MHDVRTAVPVPDSLQGAGTGMGTALKKREHRYIKERAPAQSLFRRLTASDLSTRRLRDAAFACG
jgi:hypothetical protein